MVIVALLAVGACSDGDAPPLPDVTMPGGPMPSATPTDGNGATGDDGSGTTTTDTIDTITDTMASTTITTSTSTLPPPTTLPPLVTKGAVVLVANAANVPGAAGRLTQALARLGYATNPPTNAAGWEIRLDTSKVYYLPTAKRAARSLAGRMGVEIFPMPIPVPIEGAFESFGDTTVLVMLGKDLADQPIPGITG